MNPSPKFSKSQLSPAQLSRLKAEAKSPYKGLRKFVYIACGASGFIGGMIFLANLLGGHSSGDTLPNLALQFGVVALMIFLFRWENK
jgi:hypothetical protein